MNEMNRQKDNNVCKRYYLAARMPHYLVCWPLCSSFIHYMGALALHVCADDDTVQLDRQAEVYLTECASFFEACDCTDTDTRHIIKYINCTIYLWPFDTLCSAQYNK